MTTYNRQAARTEMPFITCAGCGKRLRQTRTGQPRVHRCERPEAPPRALYIAELWAADPAHIDLPVTCVWTKTVAEAWRAKAAATQKLRATGRGLYPWVRVTEVVDDNKRTGVAWVRDDNDPDWERDDVDVDT